MMKLKALVIGAALLGACSPQTFADVASAQEYATSTVLPAVGAGGLEAEMSDFARENADPDAQARWLRIFSELGPLVDPGPLTCSVMTGFNTNPDLSGTFADCATQATYAKGKAEVLARLRKQGAVWKVDAVNVNSDYFSTIMEKGLTEPPAAPPAPAPRQPAPAPGNP